MIIAISFFAGDISQAQRLLRWMEALGGCGAFECLLMADSATPFDQVTVTQIIAERIFARVDVACTHRSVLSWPVGPNSNWWATSKWCFEHGVDWMWIEPDAIPLRTGWLDVIAAEYATCGRPFMGQIEDCALPLMPPRVMSGVACYARDTYERIPPMPGGTRPFNTDASSITVPNGANTKLIRDLFGQMNLAPVFVESKTPTSPSHHFTLDWLPKEAVLFHRDKKHSLIPLLAKRLGIEWCDESSAPSKPKLAVVFPVHPGDIHLALHHALWLRKMNLKWPHRAVIAYDPTLNRGLVNQLATHLGHCFEVADVFCYVTPPIAAYPMSANWAFQSCALHMTNQESAWLWFEPDMVVLRADWLEKLQSEYERTSKSWLGPIVANMGHMQGTAIYPADAAHRMPRAMSCGAGQAFDMVADEDTKHDRHDCGHLIHHVWTILNDAPCPVGGGSLPGPITAEQARRWFPKEAVVTHRWKTRHLVDLLMTGQYVHR